MSGQGYVQVPADSVGKKIDCVSLSASGQTVMRQVVVLSGGGSGDSQNYVTVVAGALTIGGNINAISRTACVTGSIALIAGTANIGSINNISATVTVQGNIGISSMPNVNISTMPAVVLAAGAANIGFINGISATVNVAGTFTIGTINNISATVIAQITSSVNLNISAMPAVALAAGAANIGTINGISATVLAAVTGTVNISGSVLAAVTGSVTINAGSNNIGTINNISAAIVLAAGSANIGTINGISAAVVLAAGAANIGFINKISAGVRTYQGSLAVPSASHGPKVVTLSTSAAVALVAAPGAALSIYIDNIVVTNGSGTLTRVDIYDASNTAACIVCGFAAASGGGFSTNLNPPAKVSANTALNVRVKPNVADVIVTINFHVEA
jgi:hypothetical protein